MSVTVLTASLPERSALLADAEACVHNQTLLPKAHAVSVDYDRRGAAITYNELAQGVSTQWMTFLDDDDLIDPNHLQTLMDNSDGADVVYAGCRCTGPYSYGGYNLPFSSEELQKHSLIPITALVKSEWFAKVEGFPNEWGYDWKFWQNIVNAGAKVRKLDAITWTYRFRVTPDHKHQSHGEL